MRKVVLYLGISLDGYIADEKGSVDWMDVTAQSPGSYENFIKTVDTVLMGANTYRQITRELSPEVWPYEDLKAYVFTHISADDSVPDGVEFVCGNIADFVKELKLQNGKDIWICGGADLARQLMIAGLINRFHISVIPKILGRGKRLFTEDLPPENLNLIRTQRYGEMVDVVYECVKNQKGDR